MCVCCVFVFKRLFFWQPTHQMGAAIFKFLIVYLMGVIGMCGYVFFSLLSMVRLQKQLNNVELKKKNSI